MGFQLVELGRDDLVLVGRLGQRHVVGHRFQLRLDLDQLASPVGKFLIGFLVAVFLGGQFAQAPFHLRLECGRKQALPQAA
ncbi:MAG: hypothetical protein U9N87_10100 [Planctomycetota bacterium]|nr:hypothetical protein [Planctomycetota bacterium]